MYASKMCPQSGSVRRGAGDRKSGGNGFWTTNIPKIQIQIRIKLFQLNNYKKKNN